ncbi:helix-turn-helix domain-containing protein [Thermodesulfobacteriota bacterium B35]
MAIDEQRFSALVKEIRKQLSLSQEDLARELGVSFATINRWENERAKPSKLAKAQFDRFFVRMVQRGKLKGFEGGP